MHRLLVETSLLNEESPVLPADAAKHLKVLRPKSGEEIELFDGRGRCRVFKVQGLRFDERGCLVPASETLNFKPLTLNLTLFACVTKGSRWDWTIEKATELGVTRIVPVISDRTIVRIPQAERAAKRERWMRIAEDAARQSDAKWLPEICEAVDFRDAPRDDLLRRRADESAAGAAGKSLFEHKGTQVRSQERLHRAGG